MVNTNPTGATCALNREGGEIARIVSTPAATTIKKTKHDITIVCSKPGYQNASYFNKSDAAAATFGNIILGGGIGWAIDSASGADNKYESPVNITLVPTGYGYDAPLSAPTPTTWQQEAAAFIREQPDVGTPQNYPSFADLVNRIALSPGGANMSKRQVLETAYSYWSRGYR